MTHTPPGVIFDRDGDFVDGIVESAMRTMICELKIQFQKELRRSVMFPDPHRVAEEMQQAGSSGQALPTAAAAQERIELPVACLPNKPDFGTIDSLEDIRTTATGAGDAILDVTEEDTPVKATGAGPTDEETPAQDIASSEQQDKESDADAKQRFSGCKKNRVRAMNSMIDFQELPRSKQLAILIAGSPYFDFAMGIIIVMNAVTIGMESSRTVRGENVPAFLRAIEHTLLVVYTLEIALRFHAAGVKESLKNNWVKFDCILVLVGVLNFLITVGPSVGTIVGASVTSIIANVNMLKLLRLARLARFTRVLAQFRTLWLLVQGLMYSVLPMLWTCLIMIGVVYIFAIAGMEIIVNASDDPEYIRQAENFASITTSMMTLMQFMSLDSMASIYRPLINERPVLAIYFLTFFLFGPIALMNIVTAIMVESSLRTANEDIEAKKAKEASKRKKQLAPKLHSIFSSLDKDDNGEIDIDEIRAAPEDIAEQILQVTGLENIKEVLYILDVDGNGTIGADEFVDGILRFQADKPAELIALMKQGRKIMDTLNTQRQQTVAALNPVAPLRSTSGIMRSTSGIMRSTSDILKGRSSGVAP